MKALKALVIPAAAALCLVAATEASAQVRHNWSGTHFSGRTWSGGHHWGGGHWYGPRVSFAFGVPLLWPAYYWGYPYYYDTYPRTVIYREVERYPLAYPEGEMIPPTTEVQRAPGAPAQGPLYMNYCESAQAYFPKVTSCPEGWKFVAPR